MLSFSTCWNRSRHRQGQDLAEELLTMGVRTIEFGHGLAVSQLEGLLRVVERGDLQVSSVHNFCPHPIEVGGSSPDCYEVTSHRESDRRRFVRLTQQTLDVAQRVGARAVVIHGGRVRTMHNYREVLALVAEGKFLSKAYADCKVEAVPVREAASARMLQRLEKALREVVPMAEQSGIKLGLENRERYEDVPSEREMLPFLERIGSSAVGYWHDFGHAQIKENLGFLHHRDWFAAAQSRLVGCHVHDVHWPNEDHLVPGSGEIAWPDFVEQLPPEIPVVFELSPKMEKEAVVKAWKRWQEIHPW
jgi:sugar phosphate isomerase/epimerase